MIPAKIWNHFVSYYFQIFDFVSTLLVCCVCIWRERYREIRFEGVCRFAKMGMELRRAVCMDVCVWRIGLVMNVYCVLSRFRCNVLNCKHLALFFFLSTCNTLNYSQNQLTFFSPSLSLTAIEAMQNTTKQ